MIKINDQYSENLYQLLFHLHPQYNLQVLNYKMNKMNKKVQQVVNLFHIKRIHKLFTLVGFWLVEIFQILKGLIIIIKFQVDKFLKFLFFFLEIK